MRFVHWFLYISTFVVLHILMQIGEASTDLLAANDVNDAVGFQVDKESAGSGFLGLPRNVIDFFTDLLPKLIFFNYSFLQGDLELVQWALTTVFGGTLIAMTVGQRVLGGR